MIWALICRALHSLWRWHRGADVFDPGGKRIAIQCWECHRAFWVRP